MLHKCFVHASEMEKLKDQVEEHLVAPFYGKSKEMTAVNSLVKEWHASRTQANLLRQKLKAKKTELFDKKAVDQWQLSSGCMYTTQELLNSKEVAFKVMLPGESREAEKAKETYGYYSNKVKEEFMRLSNSHCNRVSGELSKFVGKAREHLMNVSALHDLLGTRSSREHHYKT